MEQVFVESVRSSEGNLVLVFRKPLDSEHAGAIYESSSSLIEKHHPKTLTLDFSDTGTIDGAGIACLRLLWRQCQEHQIQLEYQSAPPSAEYFFRYIESQPSPPSQKARFTFRSFVEYLGGMSLGGFKEFRTEIQFIGEFVISAVGGTFHFRRLRWREIFYYIQLSGFEAMPIVFLLSFLLGLVMAFQAAIQLRQFGANIYVADLLSLALTRELGPVFTAVILAGRSGSAFAAEIGTMKVNEELDALTVMGFNITQFLVIPKVIAMSVVGPLLTLLADASGILGGIVVGVTGLDITVRSFLEETYSALSFRDVLSGLIKSFVFAVLIALIGCLRGLETGTGEDSVGRQTTSAVVSSLFMIIVADSIFTVLFHVFSW
jgi:phospholipid/cholesterol/gamma-HCH transport system permease protein